MNDARSGPRGLDGTATGLKNGGKGGAGGGDGAIDGLLHLQNKSFPSSRIGGDE